MERPLSQIFLTDERIVLTEGPRRKYKFRSRMYFDEAQQEYIGVPAVTVDDLLKATIRHRLDRIILGEIRGAEAFDVLFSF